MRCTMDPCNQLAKQAEEEGTEDEVPPAPAAEQGQAAAH